MMHFFIIPLGFVLWYLNYDNKPINNDEVSFLWEKENFDKRNKLINILKGSY